MFSLLQTLLGSVATVFVLVILVSIRHRVSDVRIRREGGVRAHILRGHLLMGPKIFWDAIRAHRRNKFAQFYNDGFATVPQGCRKCVEVSITGQKRGILTRDPEQIKTILTTRFYDFGHGDHWHDLWRPFLGDGIFAVDGKQWQESRGMIRPMFIKDRVRNLSIFDSCTEKLISKLPPPGIAVELKDLFYRWTLDTTTDFLLGENVNSLDNPKHEFAEALNTAQMLQMRLFVLSPLSALYPKGQYRSSIKTMEHFIEPIIARALAYSESDLEDISKHDQEFNFLHSIVRHSRDPKVVRDQILSVLLAGRDTTAATLSWAMYELSNQSITWARLRAEVLEVLGTKEKPTYETLKDLKYLKNILNETLRLHPAVPLNVRQALVTTMIPGDPGKPDIVLLKGDTVTLDTIGMHSDRDLYPPPSEKFADPAIFSPERWEHWTPKPWTYTPFHGGPRICVGQNFALTEMSYLLVRLAQRYSRIEYCGNWAAQILRTDIIGTPALDVSMAFFEDKS